MRRKKGSCTYGKLWGAAPILALGDALGRRVSGLGRRPGERAGRGGVWQRVSRCWARWLVANRAGRGSVSGGGDGGRVGEGGQHAAGDVLEAGGLAVGAGDEHAAFEGGDQQAPDFDRIAVEVEVTRCAALV